MVCGRGGAGSKCLCEWVDVDVNAGRGGRGGGERSGLACYHSLRKDVYHVYFIGKSNYYREERTSWR